MEGRGPAQSTIGIGFAGRAGRVGEGRTLRKGAIDTNRAEIDLIPNHGGFREEGCKESGGSGGENARRARSGQPKSSAKDKKLAAGVLSQTAQSKQPK
jgi:hypothetical protein